MSKLVSSKPLISIIVPVYNVEKFLGKCIESIITQTYTNLEIILVDDGSQDESAKICDTYARLDHRIVVIHKENAGLGYARNSGLEVCNGNYIGFVDSDDWVMPNMFSELWMLCEETNADVAGCDYFMEEDKKNYFSESDNSSTTAVLDKSEFMPLVLLDKLSSHAWRYLYKRHLFEGIMYTNAKSAEDMLFFPIIMNRAKKIALTDKPLYYYFAERPDNISNNPQGGFVNTFWRAVAFTERFALAKTSYPVIKDEVLKKAVRFSMGAFCRASSTDVAQYSTQLKYLFNVIKEAHRDILSASTMNLLEKVGVSLLLANPQFFTFLCRTLKLN